MKKSSFSHMSVARVFETVGSAGISTAIERLIQDLNSGSRILWKSPGVSVTAVALLALVIGLNTSIYSVVHAFITKPAPGVGAEDLVTIGSTGDPLLPYPFYQEYLAQVRSVESLIAYGWDQVTLGTKNGSYAFFGSAVTPGYFETLEVSFVKGRGFAGSEQRTDSPGLAAIISHQIWQDQFDGSEDVVGQIVSVNGHDATIVGVAAPNFYGPQLGAPVDVWVPLASYSILRAGAARASGEGLPVVGGRFGVGVLGRLKPGISLSQAQAEFDTIFANIAAAFPVPDLDGGQRKLVLRKYSMTSFGGISEGAPQILAVFSVITALTLLIVCANVGNLMLARAVERFRETAVRQSLGASHSRIVRMLLAEGLTISVAAWAAACVVAVWVTKAVPLLLPRDTFNGQGMRMNHGNVDFTPDWQVLAYAMLLALVATAAFSVVPAIRVWRDDMLAGLKAGGYSIARGRSRLSNALVVMQLAFAVLLLTCAGLVLRSWSALDSADLGFDKNGLLLATVNPSAVTKEAQQALSLLETLQQRLQVVPGVKAVSYIRMPMPYNGPQVEVRSAASAETVRANANYVGPRYLQTLGLKPLLGREFDFGERTGAKPVVITRNLARMLWPGRTPVGETIFVGTAQQPMEIVGIAPDVMFKGTAAKTSENFIFLAEQQSWIEDAGLSDVFRGPSSLDNTRTFYIRYDGAIDDVTRSISLAIKEVDPGIPIVLLRTLESQLDDVSDDILNTLAAIFAGGSLLIAAIGQYAIVAFNTRRRSREFGLRMAIGASPLQIGYSVLREGLFLTVIGLAAGFVLSVATGTVLASVLYGVTPTDAPTYLGVFLLLAVASLAACYLPARRAGRIDPMQTLRQE